MISLLTRVICITRVARKVLENARKVLKKCYKSAQKCQIDSELPQHSKMWPAQKASMLSAVMHPPAFELNCFPLNVMMFASVYNLVLFSPPLMGVSITSSSISHHPYHLLPTSSFPITLFITFLQLPQCFAPDMKIFFFKTNKNYFWVIAKIAQQFGSNILHFVM